MMSKKVTKEAPAKGGSEAGKKGAAAAPAKADPKAKPVDKKKK